MLKKIFAVMLLAMAIIFVSGQQSYTKAADYYVGTSPATGWQCYLISETISGVIGGQPEVNAYMTLKMVTKSGGIKYLRYHFYGGDPGYSFSNDQGFSGRVDRYSTPIESEMMRVAFSLYRE